jgi:pimeloyl-ACP methyl ester carboxylesterase
MPRRSSHHLASFAFAFAIAAGPAGCGSGGDEPVSDDKVFGDSSGAKGKPSKRSAIEGSFDVGGRKLYMECRGSGSPTVVYLHGSVRVRGGRRNAGEVPALLDNRRRVCVYDRANVGRSDSVPGPVTGVDSAKDLHALLGTAEVEGPYVLLGASLGGAISDIYAARYPHDVAGMVLLDSTLPAYLGIYKRLFRPGSGPQPGEWRGEAEKLDRLATFRQAGRVQGRRPKIPVTYIAASLEAPARITAAIRKAQRAFVDRFSPGRLIVLDVPHAMEPVIPERIAREVERVIAAAGSGR